MSQYSSWRKSPDKSSGKSKTKSSSFPELKWQDSEFEEVSEWSEVTQSCPTLCHPVDCSPPGSPIHGILQARILEWVAISFSRGSSRPRDRTQVSCIAGRHFNLNHQGSKPCTIHSTEYYRGENCIDRKLWKYTGGFPWSLYLTVHMYDETTKAREITNRKQQSKIKFMFLPTRMNLERYRGLSGVLRNKTNLELD